MEDNKITDDHYGYESREALIKAHWELQGSRINWDVRNRPRLEVAVRHRSPVLPTFSDDAVSIPIIPTLEFSFEHGRMDGEPWGRIVCEGIVVKEGPL